MPHSGEYLLLPTDEGVADPPRQARSESLILRQFTPVMNVIDTVRKKCVTFVFKNAGLLLIAASQGFLALMNVAVKKLNTIDPPVPPLELIAIRMGITYIGCLSYLFWKKVPDPFFGPEGVRCLLFLRGFSGFFNLFGIYYSLQYLSLSDATVLTFLVPLATAFAGYLFLGEVFQRRQALAGVSGLLGVLLIARPEAIFGPHSASVKPVPGGEPATPGQRLGAVGVALLGVLGATGAYTSMRAIGKRAHAMHSMSYFALWCVVTSAVGMTVLQQKFVFPTRPEWLVLLAMIGIFGFCAQTLLTMGLQRETASRGAMAIYVQIIFATILERIFFHTIPSVLSIMGTLIIMGSAVYVALMKRSTQNNKSSDNTNRRNSLDLELGAADSESESGSETSHFLFQENSAHPVSQIIRKPAPVARLIGLSPGRLGYGIEGSESEARSLLGRRDDEDNDMESEAFAAALGFAGRLGGDKEGTRYHASQFDIGDLNASVSTSPGSVSSSKSEFDDGDDFQLDPDMDKRNRLGRS